MSLIGGLVYREPGRPVAAVLARGLAGAGHDAWTHVEGPGQLALGHDAVVARTPEGWVAVSADLTNARELGLTEPGVLAGWLASLGAEDVAARVARLRGAFALAVWNERARRLVLAVDRLGFRRLYYSTGGAADGAALAFASRAATTLALAGGPATVDPEAVYAYLNLGTVPAPASIFRAVRRLPPGSRLVWQDGETTVAPWWDMRYAERRQPLAEAATALREATEAAVREQLDGLDAKRAGAFLSGGTDSSTVVGLMGRASGEQPQAFSIGFAEARYNELDYAVLAARHFGAAHYTRVVGADDALAAVPELVDAYDEPFGNNSAIPTYLCARLARETGVETLLAGDGGDEIFGGNERYRREQVLARYRLLPAPVRRGLVEPLLRALPNGGMTPLGKAQRYVERASAPNPRRFYSTEFYVMRERAQILAPEFLAQVALDAPERVAQRHFDAAAGTAELNRLMYVDLKITLGDNDLFKVTRSAARAGVTVRFPLLDHRLVELTGTLPAWHKVRGTEKRYLFKRAFAPLLPREILAKTKHGFGLPVADWLRTHPGFRALLHDTLGAAAARQRGYFAPGAVDDLIRRHDAGTTPFYGDILWTILMLELWHLRHGSLA